MPSFKYVGPYDSADIPVIPARVAQGEVFDVPAEIAHLFVEQPSNFEPVTAKAPAKADPAQEG